MSQWPSVALGDVAEISSGDGAPQDKSAFSDAGTPFIRAGSLAGLLEGDNEKQLELILDHEANRRRMRTYPAGTVVFAKSGMSCTKGLVYELKGPAHIVNHLAALASGDKVNSRFLLRWLQANSPARLIANPAYPSIKISTIRSERIPLPPLAEQKRIAAILDAADDLRAKRRESLAQLDTLLQSTFLDMFGDPVTNPMNWSIVAGEHIARRLTVGIVVKPASYYQDSGVPALRSLNVRANRIETDAMVYVSKEDNENRLKKTRVWEDDVLLVRSGQPGTAAIVPNSLDGVNAVDILILTPDQKTVHPVYICHYFNSPGGKRLVLGAQRGQIQKHLNVGALKAALIPLPPLDLQHHFAAIVKSIEAQKAKQRAHLAELDTLFLSLQSRAFEGEL